MKAFLWVVLSIATASYIVGPVVDPDLWWHIVIGRWIIQHQAVPHFDYWTMFGTGLEWRAYSWVVEVVFASTESLLGLQGLVILQYIFAGILSFVFFHVFSRLARDHAFGALVGMYCVVATFNHFTLRPQVIVWAYFALLILISDNILQRGWSLLRGCQVAFIMAAWANTHISAVLGIVVAVGWLFQGRNRKSAFLVGLFGFFGTLLTPYLGGEWVMFFHTASHPVSFASIREFAPATIGQYSTGFVIILLVLLANGLHRVPGAISGPRLMLLSAFLILGLWIVKFLPFACVLLAAQLAILWRDHPREDGINLGIGHLLRLVHRIPVQSLTFLLLCLTAKNIMGVWASPLNPSITPIRAVDFITKQALPSPLMNTFGQGGYVMYRNSDAQGEVTTKVNIDGRTNLISPAQWQNYMHALNGTEGWEKYVQDVSPQTILMSRESPLVSILIASGEWCLVYRDGSPERGDVVFVRRGYWEARSPTLQSTNCPPESEKAVES